MGNVYALFSYNTPIREVVNAGRRVVRKLSIPTVVYYSLDGITISDIVNKERFLKDICTIDLNRKIVFHEEYLILLRRILIKRLKCLLIEKSEKTT